jgi:hypothetical protein
MSKRRAASLGAELPQRDQEARALEHRSGCEHHVVPGRIAQRLGMADVLDAFVEGHAAAEPEDQHRDDQAPEVELLAVAERVLHARRALAQPKADQQQYAVEGVDRRMDALGQHRRAAGDAGHDELRDRDGDVGADRAVDGDAGFGHEWGVAVRRQDQGRPR